jgi:asparagine synthase (glutamine-hydrolysing)
MSYPRMMLQALEEATKEEGAVDKVATLFSGGLDSSIIARLLSRYSETILYTVGVEGSYDLMAGEHSASLLDLPWQGLVVNEDEILEALHQLISIIDETNPVTLSFEMPLYLACSKIMEKHIYSGQGADELFAGYAKYLAMDMPEREKTMQADLVRLMEEGLRRERVIAEYWGKNIHYPYLHEKVRAVVERIPIEMEFKNQLRKAVLRDVALLLDLGDIATRKKKAAQYGSGIMKTLKKAAKMNGTTLSGFVRQLREQAERH